MSYVETLYKENFLEYASYVIKDRAIPDIRDGFKPVQRRIIHSLFEMDDGKFHKVANVVGNSMKYHPHGDASIYSALVVLANKNIFIEKQGNFGNLFTGDVASAARYIECRLLPFAKGILYNPAITEYTESYDGRNKEPVVFPSKIPVLLIQGAEGIAVGMATKILSHNFNEVLEAIISSLHGKSFQLFPDFLGGGFIDVSSYQDGLGKVLVRAKFDTSDSKKIVIKEIPFGTTTESIISSIENASRKGKIKIGSINDFTAETVEIEIKLPRNIHTNDVIDSLYAFTDCESSISINLLVIKDNMPTVMTVTEVIEYHSKYLLEILKAELKVMESDLKDKIYARILERIFIEERIYKKIETESTKESVIKAVIDGFIPYRKEIKEEVTGENVERLLKIPIRRISLYDINKASKEIEELKIQLKGVRYKLKSLTEYAISFIEKLLNENRKKFERKTKITTFRKIDVREAAKRDIDIYYNNNTGYLGTDVKTGEFLFKVSSYDRILIIRKDGIYSITNIPHRLFVDKGMLFCDNADKDSLNSIVYSIIYQNKKTKYFFLKRFKIEKFILDKSYITVPDNCKLIKLTIKEDVEVAIVYTPKPRIKILEEFLPLSKFLVKNVNAAGNRLSTKEIKSVRFKKSGDNIGN